MHPKTSNARGFTILEILIALAVAGLILALVFGAIPTLQRNGRNNSRRDDTTIVLQALSRHMLNNSANFPTTDSYLNGYKLSYYDKTAVKRYARTADTATGLPIDKVTNLDEVHIYNYAKCDANSQGLASSRGADYRDVVALYAIETSTDSIGSKCQQL